MAAADTVAMATAIALNVTAVPASTQEICDCGGKGCCMGGWPEDAYAYMASKRQISANSVYGYWASDYRNCTATSNTLVAGRITGWERVPAFSQWALMKAVNMQPVLVYISASSPDFQAYTSGPPGSDNFAVYDGNCSTEVDHSLVVVGYSVSGNYWILKNTWPPTAWNDTQRGWGDRGYMYITMVDGPGKCGMLA